MNMLGQFKTFTADRLDIDELVALHAYGRQLRSEYEALQLEEPDFVDTQLKALKREIVSRTAEKKEARVKELKARIDALKTPAQKKKELEDELAAISK